uniref:Uncharacterized protein n=1 Tax=Caliciviridae sp. TaxID=1916234 RepID=A0A6M9Z6S6_9CALI|nr:MAG: hypothetical protein [Caliciviridae sp.]
MAEAAMAVAGVANSASNVVNSAFNIASGITGLVYGGRQLDLQQQQINNQNQQFYATLQQAYYMPLVQSWASAQTPVYTGEALRSQGVDSITSAAALTGAKASIGGRSISVDPSNAYGVAQLAQGYHIVTNPVIPGSIETVGSWAGTIGRAAKSRVTGWWQRGSYSPAKAENIPMANLTLGPGIGETSV